MWRRPNEAKPVSPEPDSYVAPAVAAPRREEAPPAPLAAHASHPPEATRITHAISIRGEISGRQDLFIDGELRGSICLPESRVTVGTNGRLKADVEAAEIVVEGQVNGNLTAGARVVLRRSGRVYGSVLSPRIAIEEGAVLNGQVDMARPGEAEAPRAPGVSAPSYRVAAP